MPYATKFPQPPFSMPDVQLRCALPSQADGSPSTDLHCRFGDSTVPALRTDADTVCCTVPQELVCCRACHRIIAPLRHNSCKRPRRTTWLMSMGRCWRRSNRLTTGLSPHTIRRQYIDNQSPQWSTGRCTPTKTNVAAAVANTCPFLHNLVVVPSVHHNRWRHTHDCAALRLPKGL